MPLDKWKLFDLLGYDVKHKEVRRFHDSVAKIKIACAPRRTTKSYSAAKDVIGTILTPNTRTWIVGMSYSLAEKEFRYIHQDLVINRDKIGLPKPTVCLTNPRSGQLYIKWPWGSVLEGKSADRPDGLLGDAVDAVIYSEAATIPRAIRERYVAPTLNTTNGYEIIPTTPAQAAEWVHELWTLGQEGKMPEVESFSWDVTANPAYNMDEFYRARKLYGADSPVFREQYLGEWVFYAGVVYPTFNPDLHVIEPGFDNSIRRRGRRKRNKYKSKEEVYYSHKKSISGGGNLDIDNTKGYGPEHYTIIDGNKKGEYKIYVRYFSNKNKISRTRYYGKTNYKLIVKQNGETKVIKGSFRHVKEKKLLHTFKN